jgi:ankyrin repeat protein
MHVLTTLVAIIALAQAPPPSTADQLQDAARKGDAATVKKLLDEGVDVNTKFRYGTTALFFACDHGHVDVVKVLLDKGADLTVKDSFYGSTPLMAAVSPAQKRRPEHTEIAKLLIAKGAPGKEDALSAAVAQGNAALTKFILDTGGLPASNLSEALRCAGGIPGGPIDSRAPATTIVISLPEALL